MQVKSGAWRQHERSLGLRGAGRYREAEPAAEEAVSLLGDDDSLITASAVLHNLGVLQQTCGKVTMAEAAFRRAADAAEGRLNDPGRPAAAVAAWCGLSGNLRLQGRLSEARQAAERAVGLVSAESSAVPEGWRALRELGAVAAAAAQFREAGALHERALTAAGGEPGGDAAVAGVLQSYARLEHGRGRHAPAEEYVRRAIAHRGPVPTFADPDELADAAVLGAVLRATGRLADAEALLRSACASYQLLAGDCCPYLLEPLEQLAILLVTTKRPDEAAVAYRRAVECRAAVLGPTNPPLATTLHDLAVLLDANGRGDEARELWERAAAVLDNSRLEPSVDLREIAAVGGESE